MSAISIFEEKQVRRAWDSTEEKWVFAIVDVIAILTDSPNPQVYWRVMKKRLMDEGNETVTNCNGLKMTAADGKQRMTDVADTEQLLRLIQSVPSPKAEPSESLASETPSFFCVFSRLLAAKSQSSSTPKRRSAFFPIPLEKSVRK